MSQSNNNENRRSLSPTLQRKMLEASSFEDTPLGQIAMDKAKQFFKLCDSEEKGFIIKRDMQRLKDELPGLNPDQLEEVFDSLDQDHNGFLTMDEFVKGFGAFIGLQVDEPSSGDDQQQEVTLADELSDVKSRPLEMDDDEQERFNEMLDALGIQELGPENKEPIEKMWSKIRSDTPEILNNFEQFVGTLSTQLRQSQDEKLALEHAFEQKNSAHDEEIKQLYDEMENQIKLEREKALLEERQKAQRLIDDMERDVMERDNQLQELMTKHTELELKFSDVASVEKMTKAENEELQREQQELDDAKAKMEAELEETRIVLNESKIQLDEVRRQTQKERRERAKAAFKVTEGIATEREGLVQQLDTLRHVNKRLQDEKDEIRAGGHNDPTATHKESILGPYLVGADNKSSIDLASESEYEVDDEYIPGSIKGNLITSAGVKAGSVPNLSNLPRPGSLMDELMVAESPDKVRQGPLGGNESVSLQNVASQEIGDPNNPERIFKVVFVGDSGVGKTCFLHRFCHHRFRSTFSATIGVDFQVKSICVESKWVALQLWDTAGQERFQSITKQYFRKADGVLLMYDVTSEQSFLNIRNWMQNVKDGVDKDCVLGIVGNKIDLCESEETRVLKYKDGQKISDEYGTLFFETSAQTGVGIEECMQAMAVLLKEKEDQHLQDALKLDQVTAAKKSGCCGRG